MYEELRDKTEEVSTQYVELVLNLLRRSNSKGDVSEGDIIAVGIALKHLYACFLALQRAEELSHRCRDAETPPGKD